MSTSSPSRKRAAPGAVATKTISKSAKTPVSKTKKTQNVGDFYNMMLSKMEPGDECPLGLKAFAYLWKKQVDEENLKDKCWVCNPVKKGDKWVYEYSLGPNDEEPATLTYEECKSDWYNHVTVVGGKLGLILSNATLLFNEGEMTRHQFKIEEEKNNHKGSPQWWCMIDGVWTAYSKKTTHMMKPLSEQNKKKMPPVVPRGEQPHRTKVIGKGSIDISTLNVKIEKETGFQYIDVSSADEEEEEEMEMEMEMDIDNKEEDHNDIEEPQKKKAKTSGKGKGKAKPAKGKGKGKGKGKAAAKTTSPKKSGKEPAAAAKTSPKKSGKEPAAAKTSPKKSGKEPAAAAKTSSKKSGKEPAAAKTSGVADDEEPANEISEAFMGNKSAVVHLFMETTGNEPTGTAKDIRKDLIDNHFSEDQLQQIGLGAGIANIKRVKKRATLVSKIMAELGNGKILPKPVSE